MARRREEERGREKGRMQREVIQVGPHRDGLQVWPAAAAAAAAALQPRRQSS